jgi:hypothetical protein
MAKTKHRDAETKKKLPYLIGKGTIEDPERKRAPYKKKELVEEYTLKSLKDFIIEAQFTEFYNGFVDALYLMKDTDIPSVSEMFESFKIITENMELNPGMNTLGMGPVNMPGAPGSGTDFHNQMTGSGDFQFIIKKEDKEKTQLKKQLKKDD